MTMGTRGDIAHSVWFTVTRMPPDQSPRILSLLSHELRGPLGVIRGYLRLLEQAGPELSDSHRQAVTAALKASDRAAELLDKASMLAQLQRQETPLAFGQSRCAIC